MQLHARNIADLLPRIATAIEANFQTPSRFGNLILLDAAAADDVMITGDLHGHRDNLRRILEIADLAAHPRRHLIMQEVCHGGPSYENKIACQSHLVLEEMLALKCQYPTRFHFLLSNHELSEFTGHPISKSGRMVSLGFLLGISEAYGDDAPTVHELLTRFIMSCPLAIRIGHGVFVTHSLPEDMADDPFDLGVFERPLARGDLEHGGDAFRLVWGRDFSAENASLFAKLVGATTLVNGHVPCPEGFFRPNAFQIVLDCCATPASYLLLKVSESDDPAQVAKRVQLLN